MQQSTIIGIIEETAPPAFAASWDKSGIQVASPRREIGHLALSLDPTPQVVQRAIAMGADMLLTHHPLSMSPRFPDRLDAYREILALLFSHNIPLYAAHTSLDANPRGPAAWLPDELGLQQRALLEETGIIRLPDGTDLQGGFGCVGDLPTPLTLQELIARLTTLLPMERTCTPFRLAGMADLQKQQQTTIQDAQQASVQNMGQSLGQSIELSCPQQHQSVCQNIRPSICPTIRRVALCTGSGASLLPAARRAKADLYITGDFKYHSALDLRSENEWAASGGLPGAAFPHDDNSAPPCAVLDVGHFTLEEEMTRRFALLLEKRLTGVKVSFLSGRDPFVSCPLSSQVSEI